MKMLRRLASGVCLFLGIAVWLTAVPAQAAVVTQLDFTSGSVALKSGSTTILSSNFTQNGQIVMGQYQPLPNVIPPVALGPYTFSLFTGGPNPVPSGSTSGSTITADLTALSAGLTGPFLPPSPGLTMNIGGAGAGAFNSLTNAFTGLTWSHALNGVSGLPTGWNQYSLQFTLNGTAQLAAVPLPGAALLFLTGLSGALVSRGARRLAV